MVQPVLSNPWLRSTESTTSSLSRGASSQHGMVLLGSFPPSYHSHLSLLGSTLRDLSTIPLFLDLPCLLRTLCHYTCLQCLPSTTYPHTILSARKTRHLFKTQRKCHLFDVLFKQIIISSLDCECSLAVVSLHP